MNPSFDSNTPAINHEELIQRLMGSAQMAERMLTKFVDASTLDCDELESIVRLGNADEIASLAHRHKGTAQTMAAPRVAAIASELEELAGVEPTSQLLELVSELRETHREVRQFLESSKTDADTGKNQNV